MCMFSVLQMFKGQFFTNYSHVVIMTRTINFNLTLMKVFSWYFLHLCLSLTYGHHNK